jgi:hypothetical protein
MTKSGDDDLLMKAELHRNIGEFAQCCETLERIQGTDELADYIDAICAACDAGNTLLFRMKFSEDSDDWED